MNVDVCSNIGSDDN